MMNVLGGGVKIDKCPALFILIKISQRHFRHLVFAVGGHIRSWGIKCYLGSCVQYRMCVLRREVDLWRELPMPSELEEGTSCCWWVDKVLVTELWNVTSSHRTSLAFRILSLEKQVLKFRWSLTPHIKHFFLPLPFFYCSIIILN